MIVQVHSGNTGLITDMRLSKIVSCVLVKCKDTVGLLAMVGG